MDSFYLKSFYIILLTLLVKSPISQAVQAGRSCANDNDCLIDLDDSFCNLNTRTCERNLVESMKCYNDSKTAGKCGADKCECPNGACILQLTICDDFSDCDNGEDEMNCECPDHMFKCNRGGGCFPMSATCNKTSECLDGSDEYDCETLELTCINDSDCLHYAGKSTVTTCQAGKCVCQQKTSNETQRCHPTNLKQSNKVGTPCSLDNPCNAIFDAFCDPSTKTCECKQDYLASVDKTKCLKASPTLNQKCDTTTQCIRSDPNTYCFKNLCNCTANYKAVNGKCLQNDIPHSICESTVQCHNVMKNSVCFAGQCMCDENFGLSADKKVCLPNRGFGEKCKENLQCAHKLGAVCNGVCGCDSNYKISEDKKSCVKKIIIGDRCSQHNDCSMGAEQMMECFDETCVCRSEYIKTDLNGCAKKGSSTASDGNQDWSILYYIVPVGLISLIIFVLGIIRCRKRRNC